MLNTSNLVNYELINIIVDFGKAHKITKAAKKLGVTGATILLGKGTVNNHILKLLDITDVRKEIIMMVTKKELATDILEKLNERFRFYKPHKGIAFTMDVVAYFGSETQELKKNTETENTEMNGIFIVIDKGKADMVVERAVKAGACGATIINGRGSGINEKMETLFSFPIEPEKEIVMILADNATTENIITEIRKGFKIDEPGKGILFTFKINSTYGLYIKKKGL